MVQADFQQDLTIALTSSRCQQRCFGTPSLAHCAFLVSLICIRKGLPFGVDYLRGCPQSGILDERNETVGSLTHFKSAAV